jgi:formate/nitrite transporter FocA (FNT family)
VTASSSSKGKPSAKEPAGSKSRHLDSAEQEQAAAHAQIKALVIHELVREEGEAELRRPPSALLWSGLAAGLSMGFSFLTLGLLEARLPDTAWRGLIGSFGYCVGFVITILGKQQLFTETTLTAMLPLLLRPRWRTLIALMRMWAIVLAANVVGTIIVAGLLSRRDLFDTSTTEALSTISASAFGNGVAPSILKAILAGWLIALMVWLLPAAGSARLLVIIILTYVVSLGQLPHVIAGSTEAAYAVFTGSATVADYVTRFLAPTLVGNIIGGVVLAALLNHAPVAHEIAMSAADAGKAKG